MENQYRRNVLDANQTKASNFINTVQFWSIAYIQSETNKHNEPTKQEKIISEYITVRSMMSEVAHSWECRTDYTSFSIFFFGIWPILWLLDPIKLLWILPENDFLLGVIILLCLFGICGVFIFIGICIRSILHRIFLHPIEYTCTAMLSFHKNQWTKQIYSDTNGAIEDISHQISTIYKLYEALYQQSQSRWLRSVSERLRTLLSESSLYMIQEISHLKSELDTQLTTQISNLEDAQDQVNWLQKPSLTTDIQTRLDRQIEQFQLLQRKLRDSSHTK